MKIRPTSKLLKSSQAANSLTHVLGQSERIKGIVEECVDELSSVNAGLEHELKGAESLPGVEQVLEKSQAVESKVQNASEELALVNQALKEEVEERHMLEERLATVTRQGDEARHAALHDPLTGLPNRALFNDRLEHGLAKAKRHGYSLAVMFLDLDDFKKINDTHGHEVGDAVLQIIAGRLKDTTRGEDTLCRHGGDEFLYMLLELRNEQDITVIAKKIIKAVQSPCDIRIRDAGISLSTSPSIGIAIYPIDGTTADALVNNADKAMYWAKRNKSGYSFGGKPHTSPS
jgi:diguanylate cyclase